MRTLLLTLTLGAIAFTANAASADEQQIIAAEKSWASAVLTKDFAKLGAMLTPDLIYAHSTGIIDDKTSYLQKMKSGKQNYAGIEHKSTTVRMHGDSAVAHSMMRMHGTNAAGPFDDQVMTMHLWVKSNGKWLLAAHQTTKVK
jgi:ketosteroid isomerase-like protein